MSNPIYLTETFKVAHPAGTRVRHPIHGSAVIVEVHPTHLVVEWDSPMARIEQSNLIEASQVPYMSRITKVRMKNDSTPVNKKTLNFNEALKGTGDK